LLIVEFLINWFFLGISFIIHNIFFIFIFMKIEHSFVFFNFIFNFVHFIVFLI
jgi:hypothetical protein